MSLTNPVLNELLVDEISKLKDSLNLFENSFFKKQQISEQFIKSNSSKINELNNKLELIQKLFNTYKTSVKNVSNDNNLSKENYNDIMSKFSLNIKNSHISIMNSFEDRLKNLEFKLSAKINEHFTKIEGFEKYIKSEYLNLNKKINENSVKISNIKSELEKTKIRLLNTERLVSNKFNKNLDSDDEKTNDYPANKNNWIKVTKKYNNRYKKKY